MENWIWASSDFSNSAIFRALLILEILNLYVYLGWLPKTRKLWHINIRPQGACQITKVYISYSLRAGVSDKHLKHSKNWPIIMCLGAWQIGKTACSTTLELKTQVRKNTVNEYYAVRYSALLIANTNTIIIQFLRLTTLIIFINFALLHVSKNLSI